MIISFPDRRHRVRRSRDVLRRIRFDDSGGRPAYTFTYTTVGEIMAWIIGWDLILEMLMAGSRISKYWGVYLNDFMRLMGWNANTNLTFGSFHIDIAPDYHRGVLYHAASYSAPRSAPAWTVL